MIIGCLCMNLKDVDDPTYPLQGHEVITKGCKRLFQEGQFIYPDPCFKGAEHDCSCFALN